MNDIILHHYPFSTFSEKVADWRSQIRGGGLI